MNLLAAAFGILLPGLIGLLTVNLAERGAVVLTRPERIGWSLVLGPTLSMLVVFLLAALGLTSFTLTGFLVPMLLLLGLLTFAAWRLGVLLPENARLTATEALGTLTRYAIIAYAVWTLLKLLAGAYDLVSVPTYWDDSFNNWNMRAKIFLETGKPVLEIPVGNGIVQTAQGVSSYPPSLPLFKTWVAVVRGSWQEPLVNGIQLLWVTGLLLAFFSTLRRRWGGLSSLFGTCLLVSLPLLLIQSMNPYAEIFVGSHLLLCVTALLHLSESNDARSAGAWLRLFALGLGLLLFTKNEATVLYAPLLTLLAGWAILTLTKRGVLNTGTLRRTVTISIAILALLALPWIGFKWMNGLTFGNAKAVSGVAIGFSTKALQAIWHHLSHEPNEMLLPLALPLLLVVTRRQAFSLPIGILSIFVTGTVALQLLLFLFVGSLETEAVMQTGLSRGLIQVAPCAMLVFLLLGRSVLQEDEAA